MAVLSGLRAGARRVARARAARAVAAGGRGPDAGSATVWLLALVVPGTVVFAGTLVVGSVVAARHRAEAAADLAALAAADRLLLDADGGCARAAVIAAAQGAGLVSCAVDRPADAVEVVAEVAVRGLPPRLSVGPARARARAGLVRAPVTGPEGGPGGGSEGGPNDGPGDGPERAPGEAPVGAPPGAAAGAGS
ncbi:Rv3654c family TadE-like protein [Kitasatospora sp. NPDC018619]|uniref:Rv3654c family TadE-like protein n=1 Tax=unclassified Kitasatospora TaxID=2633591 RepID=UPI003794D339